MINFAILIGIWVFLAVIETMRFDVSKKLSDDERQRRVESGDKEAQEETQALADAPLLTSLQIVLKTVLLVVLVAFSVGVYGIAEGSLLAIALLLAIPLLYRLSFFCRLADKIRDKIMPSYKKVSLVLKPVLKWLRDRDIATSDAILNSQDELLALIRRSPGVLSSDEIERLESSLEFDDKQVGDIMTPRSMIKAVEFSETIGPLVIDELYKTGFSRFPVYKKDLDHIEGILYLHDLLDLQKSSQTANKAMQSKVHFIREDQNLTHALHGFISSKHHLFIVVNNYRETVGLLTLEDVIEALLGKKIVDEFDAFDDLRAVAEDNPNDNNEPKGKKDI